MVYSSEQVDGLIAEKYGPYPQRLRSYRFGPREIKIYYMHFISRGAEVQKGARFLLQTNHIMVYQNWRHTSFH